MAAALGNRSGRFPEDDFGRVRGLVLSGIQMVVGGMVPFLLDSYGLDQAQLWRAAAVIQLMFFVVSFYAGLRVGGRFAPLELHGFDLWIIVPVESARLLCILFAVFD
ncbi:MAG: hypothetical protein O7G30_18965 [Proteobacteria bacterium]|nr:hypothetical protein [Pseudomonadota bacterium]